MAFLFYLLFFFIPLVFFSKTSELFEFNKMVATYGLTILIVSLWFAKMVLKRKFIFRRTLLDIPLLIFLITQAISTLISFDPRTSLLGYYSRFHGGLLSSLSYSLLYWAYVSNMDKKTTLRAISALLFSGIIVSVYAGLEHFGVSLSCLLITKKLDVSCWAQDVKSRVFATFGQPNWLAAWLVATLPLAWVKIIRGKRLWLWVVVSSFFFLALLYTKSRSGLLGLAAADLIFWLGLKTKVRLKKFLILHFVLLILLFVSGSVWTPPLTPAPQPTGPALEAGGTESAQIRKIVWKGAVDIWRHYPIFGTGVETFAFSYYNFRPVEHNLVSEWDFLYNKAHNEYLNFAATTGGVGLAAYLLLAGAIAYQLGVASLTRLALLAGFASILVTNFFGFSVVPVALTFFLYPAMAATLKVSKRKKDLSIKKPDVIQKVSIVAVLLVAFYLLFITTRYWYADVLFAKAKFENGRGNWRQARQGLQKAIKLSSKQAIFWDELSQASAGLAISFFEAGDEARAGDFSEKTLFESDWALSLSPKNINLLRSRANTLTKLSAIDSTYLFRARDVIEKAIKLAPTDAKFHYQLGLTHLRIGDEDLAVETLKKTVELKPNYRNARLALGLLYANQGEIKKGKKELEYILKYINPEDEVVRRQLENM